MSGSKPIFTLYQVTGLKAEFEIGRKLQLNEALAAPRMHNLRMLDKTRGNYEVVRPIEFKRGEVIGIETVSKAELSLGTLKSLEDIDKEEKEAVKAAAGRPEHKEG